MGFFNRGKNKKQQQQQQRGQAPPRSTAKASAETLEKTPSAERKEPLLGAVVAHEALPDDEPAGFVAGSAPAWSDPDGVKAKASQLQDPEEGDADLSLPPGYRTEVQGKYSDRIVDRMKYVLGCCGATSVVAMGLYAALAVVGITALLMATVGPKHAFSSQVNVAFVGNSYFFVNDLPRLMEQVTGEHMYQDSCLHGSGSILNLLKTGNGMYDKWQTQNAMLNGIEWITQDNTVTYLYDYGACSVPQLLTGQDPMLSYGNEYGHYMDDGSNPCLQDENYLDYEDSYNYTQSWDYVVIIDQSKRMCFEDARAEAIMGLNYTYGPLVNQLGATPIIVQPHAFYSNQVNMTGLEDVPTFTSMIMEGAQEYRTFMNTKLSGLSGRRTKIAPVGDAFLAVWEEDFDLWGSLFLEDGIHPSGRGSYLYAMVLHASIYNVMPPKHRVVIDDPMELFLTARKLHSNETGMPTKDEALVLWKVARKVTLLGFTPKSYKTVASETTSETTTDTEYYGDNQNDGEGEEGDEAAADEYTDDAADGYEGDGYEVYSNQTDDAVEN